MKKCPACGYEGEENACPTCQEQMESICDGCAEAESACTCNAEEEEETGDES